MISFQNLPFYQSTEMEHLRNNIEVNGVCDPFFLICIKLNNKHHNRLSFRIKVEKKNKE